MFWDRFEKLCRDAGKKPSPVGKEIGVSATAVYKWKEGTIPNGEILMKIADYFNCSTDYLLGRTETPNAQSVTTGDSNNNISGDNNSNHVNVGNTQLSDDTKTLVEMIQDLPLLERSKVVVMIDEMRKGA
ncbi:MAG: helix-turn-helix transcriptional regulator [Oscillospiraceae bacterium]|nr:helix-turn-helix transcriptional regulator [Oscillospiraceae bacterium]